MSFVIVDEHHLLPLSQTAALYAPYAYAAHIIRIVERGHEHLHGSGLVALGRRYMRYYRVEQRGEIASRFARFRRSYARTRTAIHYGTVELVVVRAEVEKELEHLVHDFGGTGVGAIHLVHDDDDGQTERKRVLEHETRLRHSAFERVHEQHHAVDHFEYALHFAAEIRVSRGVDDVYLIILIADGSVLREYRYAAFAFERVGIHHALGDGLPLAERPALSEHLIDQRCFAVVDVRYYRYVTYLFVYHKVITPQVLSYRLKTPFPPPFRADRGCGSPR